MKDKKKNKKKKKALKADKKKLLDKVTETVPEPIPKNRPMILNPYLVMSRAKYWLGLSARALSVALCVFSLIYFVLDTIDVLALTSLWFVFALSVLFTVPIVFGMQSKLWAFLTVVGAIGGLAYAFFVKGLDHMYLVKAATNLFDFTLKRLADSGFDVFINVSSGMGLIGTPAETAKYMVILLAILFSLIYALSFGRKSNLYAPVIINVLLVVPAFVCNIANTNWGTGFLAISYCTIAMLFVTDKLFSDMSNPRRYDTETVLNPAFVIGVDVPIAESKAEKKQRKKIEKEKGVSLDSELDDLLGTQVIKPKKSGGKRTKEERAAIKNAKISAHLKKYAKSAIAGFCALAIFVVGYIAILAPAAVIDKNFKKLEFLDESMREIREYITAILLGDDITLDLKSFEDYVDNFTAHSTDLTPKEYQGYLRFYVEVQRAMPIYLRGWVSNKYEDGSWYLDMEDESFTAYRDNFGVRQDTHERILDLFYKYMNPYGYNENTNFLTQYRVQSQYGYVSMQVNLRRYFSGSTSLYVPSFIQSKYGLRSFRSVLENEDITYSNFFDGIYTGRYSKSGAEYAVVANIPTMKDEDYATNISDLIANYNLQADYLLHAIPAANANQLYVCQNPNNPNASSIVVNTKALVGTTPLGYPYTVTQDTVSNTKHIRVHLGTADYLYIYDMSDGSLVRSSIEEPTDPGYGLDDLESTVPASNTQSRALGVPPPLELAVRYYHLYDAEERGEIYTLVATLDNYTNYVYNTYLDTAGSEIISEFADMFRDDVKSASGSDASYTASQYLDRHNLILAINEYMGENFTYTLTPSSMGDPTLTGVENFIANVKEGYCVQFASTLVLTLRELGIPARYVEGFVASDFTKNYTYGYDEAADIDKADTPLRYFTNVLDSDEHAWVEVWFDGVGWVQYEATPPMYGEFYPSAGTTDPEDPGNEETTDETTETESPDSGTEIIPNDTTEPDGSVTTTVTPVTTAPGGIFGVGEDASNLIIVIIVIAILIALIVFIIIRAKNADKARKRYIDDACAADGDMQKKQYSTDLSKRIFELLGIYGISPNKDEFADEYKLRLARDLIEATAPKPEKVELTESYDASGEEDVDNAENSDADGENEDAKIPEPTDEEIMATDKYAMVEAAIEALEAEEFGHGMSQKQIGDAAAYYETLVSIRKKKLKFFPSLLYRYILNKV